MADSKSIQQLFFTQRTDPLPRWAEAFSSSRISTLEGTGLILPAKNFLVWLELNAGSQITDQVLQLRKQIGTHPFIVLSNTPDDEQALLCFSLGAKGYLNAHASAANLQTVADVVLQGGLWLGYSLLQRLIDATVRPDLQPVLAPADKTAPPISALSDREREVALLVAQGASNKEIARQLGITERTVKAHASSIFEKLNVRDRLQLALLLNRSPAI